MADPKAPDVNANHISSDGASDASAIKENGTPEPTASPAQVATQWPNEPHPLNETSKAVAFLLDAFDIGLILIALLLIVKAIVVEAAKKQYHYEDWFGDTIYEINAYLLSGYPIIYVMIMSSCMRRIALWKAQKGAYVHTLEQFQASISLPSSIKSMWSLRSFSLTGVVIVLFWSFELLGNQAIKRELATVNTTPLTATKISYFNSLAGSILENSPSIDQISQINAVFQASWLYSQNPPLSGDNWGNLVTPSFYDNNFGTDSDGWKILSVVDEKGVPKRPVISNTVSLVGQPIIFPDYGDTSVNFIDYDLVTFTSQLTYYSTKCVEPTLNESLVFGNTTVLETLQFELTDDLDALSPKFQMLSKSNTGTTTIDCSLNSTTVDVDWYCPTDCYPTRMRLSEDKVTAPLLNTTTLGSVLDQLAASAPAMYPNRSSFVELFIQSPNSLYQTDLGYLDWSSTTTEDITYNLGTLLNSYYLASISPDWITDGGQNEMFDDSDPKEQAAYFVASTNGMTGNEILTNKVVLAWIIVDIFCNVVLAGAAITSFLIRKRTIAPDIFGYVSSLTRENKNLSLPDGGTALSGFERSRYLKNVKVRIGDSAAHEEVGRVGLTEIQSSQQDENMLNKEKPYM